MQVESKSNKLEYEVADQKKIATALTENCKNFYFSDGDAVVVVHRTGKEPEWGM